MVCVCVRVCVMRKTTSDGFVSLSDSGAAAFLSLFHLQKYFQLFIINKKKVTYFPHYKADLKDSTLLFVFIFSKNNSTSYVLSYIKAPYWCINAAANKVRCYCDYTNSANVLWCRSSVVSVAFVLVLAFCFVLFYMLQTKLEVTGNINMLAQLTLLHS